MVRGRRGTLILCAAAIAGAVFGWRAWTGGEEAAIRGRLALLTGQVNSAAGEGLAAVSHAARIGSFFTEDVVIDLGPGTSPIEGRTMLIGMAARLQPRLAAFHLELDDIAIDLVEDEAAADVRLTASFTSRSTETAAPSLDARELALAMTRDNGTWHIARLAIIETLR